MLPTRADMESAPTTRDTGFARSLCNTKAKLAIKRNDNKKLTNGGIIWEKFLALGAE